jgi:hypothetical protein
MSSDDPALSIGTTLALAPKRVLQDLAGKDIDARDKARSELARLISDRLGMSFDVTIKRWGPGEGYHPG